MDPGVSQSHRSRRLEHGLISGAGERGTGVPVGSRDKGGTDSSRSGWRNTGGASCFGRSSRSRRTHFGASKHQKPPLPKKIPPRPKITNQFKIAVDGKFPQQWATHHDYISLGEKILKKIVKKLPVSTLELPFIVWDIKNGLSCRYVYISLAGGFDFSASSSLPDPHGPWNDFSTEKPIGCWQFGRGARMTTAGVGGHSKTYLHIDTPAGVNNVVTTIDTGITIKGASGSIGLPGDFILMEAPALFGGP